MTIIRVRTAATYTYSQCVTGSPQQQYCCRCCYSYPPAYTAVPGIYGRSLYIQHVQQWYAPEFSTPGFHETQKTQTNKQRGERRRDSGHPNTFPSLISHQGTSTHAGQNPAVSITRKVLQTQRSIIWEMEADVA